MAGLAWRNLPPSSAPRWPARRLLLAGKTTRRAPRQRSGPSGTEAEGERWGIRKPAQQRTRPWGFRHLQTKSPGRGALSRVSLSRLMSRCPPHPNVSIGRTPKLNARRFDTAIVRLWKISRDRLAMLHSFGRKTLPEFREAKVGAIDFQRGLWRSLCGGGVGSMSPKIATCAHARSCLNHATKGEATDFGSVGVRSSGPDANKRTAAAAAAGEW